MGFKNFRMWCLGRNTRLLHSAKYFLVYLVNGSLAGERIADEEEPMRFFNFYFTQNNNISHFTSYRCPTYTTLPYDVENHDRYNNPQ